VNRKGKGQAKTTPSDPSEPSPGIAGDTNGASENGEPPVSIMSTVEFNARVARKAFELFERRGGHEGHDVEDWLEAERLVKEELFATEAHPQ
jgi:hypothetical protein